MRFPGGSAARMAAAGRRWLNLTAAAMLAALLYGGTGPIASLAAAQQFPVTVSIDPAQVSVAAGDQFEVAVVIAGMADLGGFQLLLQYDPALIQIDEVSLGEFLGSTGRDVVPLGPNVDSTAGRVDVGAFSSGTTAGASGTGVLVKLACTAMQAGQGTLGLANIVLSDTKAATISATTADGKVTLTGNVIVPTAPPPPPSPTAEATSSAPPAEATSAASPAPTATTSAASPALTAGATSVTATEPTGAATSTAAATPSATAQDTPVPNASATVAAIETHVIRVATQTAQAWGTARAQWTATPTVASTPVLTAPSAPQATPTSAASMPAASSGAGLAAGLGVVALALGAGGVYLWRRGRQKSS
jgi:hypothetical protein